MDEFLVRVLPSYCYAPHTAVIESGPEVLGANLQYEGKPSISKAYAGDIAVELYDIPLGVLGNRSRHRFSVPEGHFRLGYLLSLFYDPNQIDKLRKRGLYEDDFIRGLAQQDYEFRRLMYEALEKKDRERAAHLWAIRANMLAAHLLCRPTRVIVYPDITLAYTLPYQAIIELWRQTLHNLPPPDPIIAVFADVRSRNNWQLPSIINHVARHIGILFNFLTKSLEESSNREDARRAFSSCIKYLSNIIDGLIAAIKRIPPAYTPSVVLPDLLNYYIGLKNLLSYVTKNLHLLF
ncbi:MAG: hypothetical protein QXM38_04025 [Candidatus Aenigmatarchaeota archaeon]